MASRTVGCNGCGVKLSASLQAKAVRCPACRAVTPLQPAAGGYGGAPPQLQQPAGGGYGGALAQLQPAGGGYAVPSVNKYEPHPPPTGGGYIVPPTAAIQNNNNHGDYAVPGANPYDNHSEYAVPEENQYNGTAYASPAAANRYNSQGAGGYDVPAAANRYNNQGGGYDVPPANRYNNQGGGYDVPANNNPGEYGVPAAAANQYGVPAAAANQYNNHAGVVPAAATRYNNPSEYGGVPAANRFNNPGGYGVSAAKPNNKLGGYVPVPAANRYNNPGGYAAVPAANQYDNNGAYVVPASPNRFNNHHGGEYGVPPANKYNNQGGYVVPAVKPYNNNNNNNHYPASPYNQNQQPLKVPAQIMPLSMHGPKRAVLIGVSYNGHDEYLKGSVYHVNAMKSFLVQKMGFPPQCIYLLTEDEEDPSRIPTKRNIQKAMRWLIEGCQSGDSLVLHYSGHASKVRDRDGDELDGYDECLCPLDYDTEGKIVDDEINDTIVRPLPHGAKLHAIIDTASSGSLLDLKFICKINRQGYCMWEDHSVPHIYKGTRGGLAFCFSASADQQYSEDPTAFTGGLASGSMTYSFINAMDTSPRLTYGSLLNAIRYKVNEGPGRIASPILQEPQLSSSEKIDVDSMTVML